MVAGMGEICVSADASTTLTCLGIGSCIALSAYDPVARVGGLAHIVLPEGSEAETGKYPGKYATTAVPALLAQMSKLGAEKQRLVIKLVGGAQMIQAEGFGQVIQMGARNTDNTHKSLAQAGLRVAAEDVGGASGRSLWLQVGTGKVTTKTAYSTPREL